MCGIFWIRDDNDLSQTTASFKKIEHRGPDESVLKKMKDDSVIGFHRLSIVGGDGGSQPIRSKSGSTLVCNGEIYNYTQFSSRFEFTGTSDCEVICCMIDDAYNKYGGNISKRNVSIKVDLASLDGPFAFVWIGRDGDVVCGRSCLGIRSMVYATPTAKHLLSGVASEMKALHDIFPSAEEYDILQFPPGTFSTGDANFIKFDEWVNVPHISPHLSSSDDEFGNNLVKIQDDITRLFTEACEKRMMGDRGVCALLSGGLDSSSVCSAVCNYLNKRSLTPLKTYSIGLEGSSDLKYAEEVATYLKTDHTSFVVSAEEFFDAIPEVVKTIESYCITSVRASVGNYLVCKKLKEHNPDNTVVFCGDVADEIFGSYLGFAKAQSTESFESENRAVLNDIHYYDVNRSCKTISAHGLEARVPFADKELVKYVMSLPAKYKMFGNDAPHFTAEKGIFRDGLYRSDIKLPHEVLYRRKEAFSDGVSLQEETWCDTIQRFIKKYNLASSEEEYYKSLFDRVYPNRRSIIPENGWRQPFCDPSSDPSATKLDFY